MHPFFNITILCENLIMNDYNALIERSDEVDNIPDYQFFIDNEINIIDELYIMKGDEKIYINTYGADKEDADLSEFLKQYSHVYSINLSRYVSFTDNDAKSFKSFKVRGLLKK